MVTTILILIALLAGLYMSWSIGANDVANAMGTSVGSKALTLRQAVFLAAVMEFVGAFFFGERVTATVQSGIIDISLYAKNPQILAFGMISSLLAAGVWLQCASYWGWPVSTTHTIIGSVVGFGLLTQGVNGIYWNHVIFILSGWFFSPVLGGLLSFFFFIFLRRAIFYADNPALAARFWAPFLVFFVGFILVSFVTLKGFSHLTTTISWQQALLLGLLVGLIGFAITFFGVRHLSEDKQFRPSPRKGYELRRRLERARKHLLIALSKTKEDLREPIANVTDEVDRLWQSLPAPTETITGDDASLHTVETIFRRLQIMSAGLMAFAHGANDVANAIGPLSASLSILTTGEVNSVFTLSPWILALGGFGIVIGLASWGWRVIETIGKKITELTPTRGFSAEFGAAMTIVFASGLGLPISTTQTLVGSVLGVGLARGIGAINFRMTRDIFASWFVTVPIGALLTIIFFFVFTTFLRP